MMFSLMLVPVLNLTLAAPATPDDQPYAKVELRGMFRYYPEPSPGGVGPARLVVRGVEFELEIASLKEVLTEEAMKELDGVTLVVEGSLHFANKKPRVVVSSVLRPLGKK